MTNQPDTSPLDGVSDCREVAGCQFLTASALHQGGADDPLDRHPQAVSPVGPADAATIIPLPSRRTYLDACRDQGVFQEREEIRAEIFDTRGEIAAKRTDFRRETGRLNGTAPTLSIIRNDQDPEPVLTPEEALAAKEASVMQRVTGIMQAYADAGLGNAYFPLLMRLISTPDFKLEDVNGVFEAVLGSRRGGSAEHNQSDAAAHERRRLGLDQEGA